MKHHDVYMRMTLTLEDDVAEQLAQLVKKTDQPFQVVVNETLRRGLARLDPAVSPFHYQPHAGNLLPGIDDRRLNEIAWQKGCAKSVAKSTTTPRLRESSSS